MVEQLLGVQAAAAGLAVQVARIPRFMGTRWGVNSTCGAEVHVHLGGVAVGEQPVGGHVLVHGAEGGGAASGPGRPRRPLRRR